MENIQTSLPWHVVYTMTGTTLLNTARQLNIEVFWGRPIKLLAEKTNLGNLPE